ncbi:MAG: helix-turn-helix transcriptional regulator [Ruminococcaceae bacterium]|nr:helix-turn-helix transcriptional regulator [Oscillospiraceae bacterium]
MEAKDFALRLAKLRAQKGVTARDMSLSMGQNPNYINHIETGRTLPSLTGVFYICEYLGVTPSEFFDEDNKNPKKLDEITRDLRRLSPAQLETVAALVKQLAGK